MKSIKTIILLLSLFVGLSAQSITIDYQTGWNMVGLPLDVEDTYYQTLFPDAFNNALYSFVGGSYSSVEYLVPGTGYLLRLSDGGTVEFSGTTIDELTLSLIEGWNLISGISTPVDTDVLYNSGLVVTEGIYGYDGSYFNAETIDPGKGYWVRALSDGEITFEEISFGDCAFIEIPPSNPDHIVVQGGGGIESTQIKAEIYDDDGNLMNTPAPVTFRLNPVLSGCYLDEEGQTEVTVYTVDGIASVSVNSGTEPGVVRIEVEVDCDQDGTVDLSAASDQVIISSGAPYYIEPEYDPNSTTATGGGFYQTQCAAIVYDRWYNPVEDSTYVYWTIEPTPPDTLINAFVDGVSFTGNENLDGDIYSGMAFTTIVYSTDAIGDIGYVSATTYGANGDTITARINEDEGETLLFFLPGQVSLMADATYWDFTLNGNPALIQVTAIVIDYYGNAVVDAPIAFTGTGVNAFYELGYETYTDSGVLGAGIGDLCFSWRDYGLDDDPSTLDWGTFNDHHDGFDTNNDGLVDTSEISEPFDDFGMDGVDGTFDQGEGNGEWDGYSMIGCEPIVMTDEDGVARIIFEFDQALCTLANQDDETGICTWDDFTAILSATLLIPEITTSDPLDVFLVRTPANCPP